MLRVRRIVPDRDGEQAVALRLRDHALAFDDDVFLRHGTLCMIPPFNSGVNATDEVAFIEQRNLQIDPIFAFQVRGKF